MHRRARDTVVGAVLLANVLTGCGATATAAPSGDAGPTIAALSSPSGGSASASVAAQASPPEASASLPVSSSPPASSAPASPPANGTVPPLPPPGAAHRFGCASLISAKQVTSITHIPAVLFAPAKALANLPKGETQCKYTGTKFGPGKSFAILTTDVTVLTGAARATFDATWATYRDSPFISTVPGVGDDAAWLASQDTLVGIVGRTAFVVTLEPSPLSIFTPASALATASSLAKILVPHL
jgi:hypothetical protein